MRDMIYLRGSPRLGFAWFGGSSYGRHHPKLEVARPWWAEGLSGPPASYWHSFYGVLLDAFGGRREKAAPGVEAGDQDNLSGCAVVIRTRLGVAWGKLKDGVTGGTRHLDLGVDR